MRNTGMALLVVLLVTGCGAAPPPRGTASASSVGDLAVRMFEEVVATFELTDAGPRNLHAELAVTLNSAGANGSSASGSMYWLYISEALGIISRADGGISAAALEAMLEGRPASIADLPSLKERVEAAAQRSLDATFSSWSRAGQFEARIAVTSFYWTDLSVGRRSRG